MRQKPLGEIQKDMDKNRKKEASIICPHCGGYGYYGDEAHGGPCLTCCGCGWLMKSQLEEWESQNCASERVDEI